MMCVCGGAYGSPSSPERQDRPVGYCPLPFEHKLMKQTEEPRMPRLDMNTRSHIGAHLRSSFEELGKEPIPDEHAHLLLTLRHKERDRQGHLVLEAARNAADERGARKLGLSEPLPISVHEPDRGIEGRLRRPEARLFEPGLRGLVKSVGPTKKASEYREYAEECRVLAKWLPAGEQRDQLLSLAATWDNLAVERSELIRRQPELALHGEHDEGAEGDRTAGK